MRLGPIDPWYVSIFQCLNMTLICLRQPCTCCVGRQVLCRGRILAGSSCDYCRRKQCWCSHVHKSEHFPFNSDLLIHISTDNSKGLEPQAPQAAPAQMTTEERPPEPKHNTDLGTSTGVTGPSTSQDNQERGRPAALTPSIQERLQDALKSFADAVADIVADALEERGPPEGLSDKGKGKEKAKE